MFKITRKHFLLRPPSIYEIPGYATQEERKIMLLKAMIVTPRLMVRGGTSKTNPYKNTYDLIIAERRA